MNSTVAHRPSEAAAWQPGPYFVQHPWQYQIAVTAATATAVTGFWQAALSTGWRRIRYALLGIVETAVVIGIVDATNGSGPAHRGLIRPLD